MFRYEVSWDLEEECIVRIAQCWNRGPLINDSLIRVQYRLKKCQESLKRWRVLENKNRNIAIKTKSEQLKCLQDKEDPTILREIMKL